MKQLQLKRVASIFTLTLTNKFEAGLHDELDT